jgi:hypothetical protein
MDLYAGTIKAHLPHHARPCPIAAVVPAQAWNDRWLEHRSKWWRDTAQRLLVVERPRSVPLIGSWRAIGQSKGRRMRSGRSRPPAAGPATGSGGCLGGTAVARLADPHRRPRECASPNRVSGLASAAAFVSFSTAVTPGPHAGGLDVGTLPGR